MPLAKKSTLALYPAGFLRQYWKHESQPANQTSAFLLQMSKKPDLSEDDAELFRQAMRGVRRLAHDKASPHHHRPSPRPLQKMADERRVLQDMMSDPMDPAYLETGEELLFSRCGVQHRIMRKLRRGQYSVEDELDLHRMTAVEARQAIVVFLQQATARGIRCARIIHGKGHGSFNKQPVLKAKVNHWLRQRNEILAFCSARPVDGGTGAVYVLLRNPHK